MDISEQTRIPSPLAEVWPLLSDPATVAGCIPGAQFWRPTRATGSGAAPSG